MLIPLGLLVNIYSGDKLNLASITGLKNKTSQNSSQSGDQKTQSKAAVSIPNLEFTESTNPKNAATVVAEQSSSVLSLRVKTKSNIKKILSTDSESAGTGFIITEDGVVITNRHVISQSCKNNGADDSTTISALSGDNKSFTLEILTIDPIDDIAILKIKNSSEKFKPVTFADSSKLKQGGDVIAIGNVLGEFGNTVTRGIVSGLNRTLQTALTDECTGRNIYADGLIQTDAAINQGNSGGPLFDNSGNVIGMNTFGATTAQNIGFSIPSSTLASALASYKKYGKITRAKLGVVSRPLDPSIKSQYEWLPVEFGELIYNQNGTAIAPGSAAFKAGLKEGDIITEIDGKKLVNDISNTLTLRKEILTKAPESEINLTVLKVISSDSTTGGYKYEKNPVNVKVTLGATSFDISSNLANVQ